VVGAGGIPCRRVGPRIDDLPPGVVRWCKEDADAHVVVGKRRERLTVVVAVYLVVELETASVEPHVRLTWLTGEETQPSCDGLSPVGGIRV
jgi:hypothetical protein